MKHFIVTLCVLAALSLATGFVAYRASGDRAIEEAARRGDAMQWLRADFHLNDEQFEQIRRLHAAYSGTCEEHCRRIQEATRAQRALLDAHASPAEVQAAGRNLQRLRETCESALTEHVRRVAQIMSPGDARRYLAIVLPKIASFDHAAAPDVHMDHSL